jgi:hypothetical protein
VFRSLSERYASDSVAHKARLKRATGTVTLIERSCSALDLDIYFHVLAFDEVPKTLIELEHRCLHLGRMSLQEECACSR